MKFGVGIRNKLTGAELTVRVVQIASLLPGLYLLAASGYRGLFAQDGMFGLLFRLGMSLLPRWEAWALSVLYRLTSGELVFYFTMLGLALAWGLLSRPLLGPQRGVVGRTILAGLIAADLVLRLLPLSCNAAFGLPMAVIGFCTRFVCLVLVLLDLRAHCRGEG